MKLYEVLEAIMNQDGSEESWGIGIFDNRKQADEACEKIQRSIMYDSEYCKRVCVREKQLNEANIKNVYIPKEGQVVLKLRYMYIGSMTDSAEEKADPIHYNINFQWFLNKATATPVEKNSSEGAVAYIPVIEDESSEDFRQRKVARFHEMWEKVNKIRSENGLVTLPFELQ